VTEDYTNFIESLNQANPSISTAFARYNKLSSYGDAGLPLAINEGEIK
jgi:hypothetical protein